MKINPIRFTVNHTAQHHLCVRTRVLTRQLREGVEGLGTFKIFPTSLHVFIYPNDIKLIYLFYKSHACVGMWRKRIYPKKRRHEEEGRWRRWRGRNRKSSIRVRPRPDVSRWWKIITCPEENLLLKSSLFFDCFCAKSSKGWFSHP